MTDDHPIEPEPASEPASGVDSERAGDVDTGAADAEPSAADARWRGLVRRPVAAVVVLLVAAVAAVVWGMAQRGDADDLRIEADRQRAALLAASGFVEALLSYDHQNLDAQQTAVEGFATETFRDEYVAAFTAEVRAQIVAEEASSVVTIQDVFLTLDDDGAIRAIVHARSDVSSAGGASANLESYLLVQLVHEDGSWLVEELTSLGSRDIGQGAAPPEQPEQPDQPAGSGENGG